MAEVSISTWTLLGALVLLVIFSAFFSASETSLMALNRYKLKHLAKTNARASKIYRMLQKPEQILGVILIGNNFVNITASVIGTLLFVRWYGPILGPIIATIAITIVILIFAEITPKTLAALKPEKIAYPAIFWLHNLSILLYPFVVITSAISKGLLRFIGVKHTDTKDQLNIEELKTLMQGPHLMLAPKTQNMLLSILELNNMTVDDIIVPKQEIVGIDLSDDEQEIQTQLTNIQHSLIPVYTKQINDLNGILHIKDVANLLAKKEFTKESLLDIVQPCYFVPEGTPLYSQLLSFQQEKTRLALVVDEYGDLLGLITLEDILEEVVGQFTTDQGEAYKSIHPQEDGSIIVEGTLHVRELNKEMNWEFPIAQSKTLNGMIVDYLGSIPAPSTCVKIADHPIEILHIKDNMI